MLSLKNIGQRLLDSTTLDEKVGNFFRPKTGTLASTGRKWAQELAAKPAPSWIPQQVQQTAQNISDRGGFNRLKQEFTSNPAQFTPLSMKSAAVDTGRKLGSEDLGYGLRGALSLTPFQSAGKLTPKLSAIQQTTAPTTGRQQAAQSIGQTLYGTALTAPLSTGKTVLKSVGNVARNLAVGGTTGALMQGGSDLLTGNFSKESLKQGALSGLQNSWVLPVTNSLTDAAILKLFPKAGLKITGAGVTDPFKLGKIKEGFGRLLTQSLAQVPAENTAFTFLNQLDDKTKGSFTENWMNNLPGNIVGNILSAGVSGSVNVFSNPQSRKIVTDAMKKTVDEWNTPVTMMGGEKMPMWKYKMMYETKPGFARLDLGVGKDTPKLSVEPTTNNKFYINKYADNSGKNFKFEEVPGKKVDILPGVETFVHKNEGGGWTVTEARSGQMMTTGKTQAEAINKAREATKKMGNKVVMKYIEDKVKSNGLSPRFTQPSKPLSVEPVGGDLLAEAKKYKSAEDFAQFEGKTLFRGTGENGSRLIKNGEIPKEGLSMSLDPSIAKSYAKGRGLEGRVVEQYLSPNAKTITLDEIPNSVRSSGEGTDFAGRASIWARKQGYDVLDMTKGNEVEMRVLTKDALITKDQQRKLLTDIYSGVRNNPQSVSNGVKNSLLGNDNVNINGGVGSLGDVPTNRLSNVSDVHNSIIPAKASRGVAQGGLSDVKPTIKGVTTKPVNMPQLNKQVGNIQPVPKVLTDLSSAPKQPLVQQAIQTKRTTLKLNQPSESIIQEARKQIGSTPEPQGKSVKQSLDDLYTQWVDRYNPLTKASNTAKKTLKLQGAELRPENDPTYLVRRLTGAGGIADARFRTELNPILKEMETLNIPKTDMDVYLANKRMAGFGQAGRDIYGSDPVKAGQVVSALESKYPQINGVAQKMYSYQDKGLNEITDAGFLSPEAVASLKSQNPDYAPLYRVMDEMDTYLGLPTRKTMQGTSPIAKIKGSTRKIESPVESIIGNTFRQRAAIEKNRVAQSVIDLQKISPDLGFTKVSKSAPDTITIWKNGQKEYWQVGQEIADTAKGVNEESMNVILKVLQAPAALLRQGATGRNPEFMLPNIIRDQLDAGVASKYGYIPFIDYVSGLKSMLTNDDVYKKWESSGAKIDLGELSGKKEISALFNEKVEKRKLFSWLGDTLDFMGKYSEQPTRVGLFKKAYNKTGNELLSAMESRDATVDFARMGSKMKVANSIVPFLNVGVQGFDKLVRTAKNNPGRLAFTLATYAVAPQVVSTMYNLMNYPEEYKEIPEYEKDANFVFITGRNSDGTVNYKTIPKGNIMPIATNPTQSFLEFAFSNDPQSFKEMALRTLSGTLPVLGEGSSLKEIGIKTIGQNLPQAIKPITENLLNKSFYKYDAKKEQNKDIVPAYLQNKPEYLQKYDFTPQMYQKIGAVLNTSPLKVQNLMEGYLAGYSKIPAQILEVMNKVSKGESISDNEKTILRRFSKTTYPSSSKPALEKQPVPSLMERVTGKVGASETSTTKELPQWQIDNAKDKLRSSKELSAQIGELYLVKRSDGDIETIDISSKIEEPKYTGQTEVDKKLVSAYKGKITSRINDIVKLVEAGKIEPIKAEEMIKTLKATQSKLSGGKKPKKITIKTTKAPRVSFKLAKPTKMSVIKAPTSKRARISFKNYKPAKIKV